MKPQLEHVTLAPGESCALRWRQLPEIPFHWHYHAEFELTLTLNARGHRYVGDSIEAFEPGDLVLVGPNQPHTWAAEHRPDPSGPMLAVVVWFSVQWLERLIEGWPEFSVLDRLKNRAGRGLRFTRAAAAAMRPLMLSLGDLDPPLRLPVLLQILATLARDARATPLAAHAAQAADEPARRRLAKVLERLHADIARTPNSRELANAAALSVGAFHCLFKRHMGMTVLDYLGQLRIGRACQELIGSDRAIGAIATESGFGTAAHFNRQFVRRKGMTPRAFRARYRQAAP